MLQWVVLDRPEYERQMIPSYAALRDRIAERTDPHRVHRISEHTTAFSVSLTSSYAYFARKRYTFVFCSGQKSAGEKQREALGIR